MIAKRIIGETCREDHLSCSSCVRSLLRGPGRRPALAQAAEKPFEPIVGQAGKDVVWVPTPPALVEKMLDMAKVTSQDFVMDLGSGDGRNIIAAAKRGARALGVEYNEDMVKLSQGIAAKEGVADKAKFVQGDMYEADISQATVLALFLLTENLNKLTPKFLQLKPGTRIVIERLRHRRLGRRRDRTAPTATAAAGAPRISSSCRRRVEGTWRLPQGQLTLQQKFQKLSGTLNMGGDKHADRGRPAARRCDQLHRERHELQRARER